MARRFQAAISSRCAARQACRGLGVFLLCSISCHQPLSPAPAHRLRFALHQQVSSLDPRCASQPEVAQVSSQIYETLLQVAPSADARTDLRAQAQGKATALVPGLLAALPTVSRDGLTYSFQLKAGSLFQDDPCFQESAGRGRELTADDVIASIKRLALDRPPQAELLQFIVGLGQWRENQGPGGEAKGGGGENGRLEAATLPIEGLKRLDRYRFHIILEQSEPDFLALLAHPLLGIVAREADRYYGSQGELHPVGSGPYVLAGAPSQGRIVLKRNLTHLPPAEFPASGAREEALPETVNHSVHEPFNEPCKESLSDQLIFEVMPDLEVSWLKFVAGELDFLAPPPAHFHEIFSPQSLSPSLQLTPAWALKKIEVFESSGWEAFHFALQAGDPWVGKNKFLRQALSVALDRNQWVSLFFPHPGRVAHGFWPQEEPAEQAKVKGAAAKAGLAPGEGKLRSVWTQWNLKLAKELLVKAGFPGGAGLPPLEYASLNDSLSIEMADELQKQWAVIGVRLNLSFYSPQQLQKVLANREAQIWLLAGPWPMEGPDPTVAQLQLLDSFAGGKERLPWNPGGFSSPGLEQSLARMEKTLLAHPLAAHGRGGVRRWQRQLFKLHRLLVEECPLILGGYYRKLVVGYPQSSLAPQRYRPWIPFSYESRKFYHKLPEAAPRPVKGSSKNKTAAAAGGGGGGGEPSFSQPEPRPGGSTEGSTEGSKDAGRLRWNPKKRSSSSQTLPPAPR